jgi:hypothetical protein
VLVNLNVRARGRLFSAANYCHYLTAASGLLRGLAVSLNGHVLFMMCAYLLQGCDYICMQEGIKPDVVQLAAAPRHPPTSGAVKLAPPRPQEQAGRKYGQA